MYRCELNFSKTQTIYVSLRHQLNAEIDPNNAGVLLVQINAGSNGGVGPEEISRRLERSDESCVVM